MIFWIVGILFSMLVDSVVDLGFDSQSGRHNDWYLLFIIRAWSVKEWEQNPVDWKSLSTSILNSIPTIQKIITSTLSDWSIDVFI
jgi:transcription termination factor NusB